ncbi:DMT family transporter [Liquorilactobacillus satsumensis]|uniref:DMT family transporter n=1 Tax=Liquorilactobacillus satsumensis TaxID=259059 RepID=UPI0039E7FB44
MFLFALATVIGIFLPLQTAINSRLRSVVRSSFAASAISFTTGTLCLAVVVTLSQGSLIPAPALFSSQPVWLWVGGLLGVIFLTGNILLFPHLGGVQTVIMPILGQIIASLTIDNFGLFYSQHHPLTLTRILGALIVVLGVFFAIALPEILHKNKLSSLHHENQIWLWRFFGILTGSLSATQTAINGHLGSVLHSALNAAFISFFVGSLCLWCIVLGSSSKKTLPRLFNVRFPWWAWSGGLLGAAFVAGNSYLVPLLGTGVVTLIVLLGMIIGSLVVDHFGLFESPRRPLEFTQIFGIVIMIIGVSLIKLLQ